MNNIYKVIWSKAKNCYVVASEIARSHTKSASGSEKIGGVARHALLALGAACAIACGGFVNVGAVEYEHVDVTTTGTSTATVYTKNGTEAYVENALSHFDTKDEVNQKIETLKTGDVATNKNDIAALQATTIDQGQKIATNTANIANNKDAIDKKIDKETANATYATKEALNNLTTTVNGKADLTALEAKADKTYVDQKFTEAGTSVDTKLANYATTAYVDGKIADEVNARDNKITAAIGQERTDRDAAINTAIAKEVADRNQAIDTAIAQEVTDRNLAVTNAKTELQGKITEEETARKAADVELTGKITAEETARTNADNALDNRLTTAEGKIGANETAIGDLKAKDTVLEGKITTLDGKVTTDITGLQAKDTELAGKIQTNANNIQTNKNDITTIKQRTAGIDRIDARHETTIEGHVTVDDHGNVTADGKLKAGSVDAGTGDITTTGAVNAGSLNVTDASHLKGDVTMDKTLSVTGDTSLGALNVTGESNLKNTTVDGTLTTTGKATFQEAVEMDKGLTVTNGATTLKATTVDGKLTAGDADFKNTQVNGTLNVTDATTLGGALIANGEATFKENVTMEKDLEVKGELKTDKISMKNTDTDADGWKHDSATTITADGITHIGEVEKSGVITKSQFTHTEEGSETYAKKGDTTNWTETRSDVKADGVKTEVKDSEGNRTNTSQTADGIKGYATDKAGNKTYTKVTATENSFQVQDKDGKNKNHQVNTMDSSVTEIKNAAGATTKTEQTAENITNTAQNGTITNDAMNIVNNASGNMTNTVGGNLSTTVGGNEIHEVKGTKTETVEGKVTENFKNGQETNVTGNQDIHVTGKQTNTVGGGQENIISGGQTNTITGGQINNITGDQTTNVSGTQTTTATDINRNASSSMVDKVDNAYGTNTETKEAGKTTTDVSIKGTGEKGQYIRGANESRDYLIKGTLKNSETKTVEKTSTEITDGTNKASTIQDAKNLAGSVTNGTETGISGIHANDDGSVSIDSAVAGGGMSSVINQKKDSIQSAVGDGTNSTVIHQDKDNVTIASSNGTVGIVGKDIVNNAQNTITNTAGTSITNQVNDSKVTTDANGTTFENNTPAVSDGGATTTKINGNQITTGRVNANELGVSDKDGANTADFSVEAGEGKGVNASAGNGTTTGSLDVTAEEVSSSVKDASGKGSTFKQRIDKIMMESKDVSIKAEETLTNEAKVITNKASEVINNEAVNINNTATGIITSKASEIKNQADKLISNKVGENTWENMENGKITTSIKDGAKQNLTQSNAAGTTQSTVDVGKSTVTIQNADGLVDVVTDGTNTSVQNQTASQIAAAVKDEAGNENASVANATTSANTIKSGSKANTVISTADGTSFINSEAAAPVGEGTAVNTTIKGNTITTGKVTMDYAEVMKDLGVHGNAKVDQNLEVGGTSTLKGDVTMESNATVKKDLKVEGTTTTKTLKVTENAEIDGTLKVAKKATFEDSVSIAKDLSVGGDVTANSYKVGDKTYIDANGIHANGQKITDVADGSISEGSKDAVNGGQLYGVKRDLEHQVDKVGANAAAMANLRPMEFDPSSKWNIAAAIGNYGSETAAALGAFYRPNDDVMVNLSTAFGTGENMVGGGVSVRLGKSGNKLSREENNALKAQVDDLTARMDALLSVLNPNMSKDFPDVPENHWAYEAVSRLAGNDIVQGYPDGEFHGERTMTRYEMAEIIYNALSRGAEAERELVEEFKPELQAMAASEKATAEKA